MLVECVPNFSEGRKPEVIEAILEREKPDAILPTMGGQTALNVAMELNRNGALARHNVKLIGAKPCACRRRLFDII